MGRGTTTTSSSTVKLNPSKLAVVTYVFDKFFYNKLITRVSFAVRKIIIINLNLFS